MQVAYDFSLIETMRWEGEIALLERHLDRLSTSAEAIGFLCDVPAVRRSVLRETEQLDASRAYRVRLAMSRAGKLAISSILLDVDPTPFSEAVLHPEPVSRVGELRAHKTSAREEYESALRRARGLGCDEAILFNEDDEVVEGTRTNVWLRRDSEWITPPLDSGALGGVYRRFMLETWTDTHETRISKEELLAATEVGLSNAIHGFRLVPLRRED